MGDTSPKNKHKLQDQKHEEHEKKEDVKHHNAEVQHHHVNVDLTSEQIVGLPNAEQKKDS
jgi:hypothetical protein